MPDTSWWVVHGFQEPALLTCCVLAMLSSRRVGGNTPYGTFLFVVALAFWLLLAGDLVFMGRVLTGTWSGPGTLADAYLLSGWLILDCAFFLLAVWFPPRRFVRLRARVAVAAAAAAAGAATVLGLAVALQWPGVDSGWTVRAAHLALDGVGLGVLGVGLWRLASLRRSTLGTLYLFLAAALVVKTAADLAWAAVSADGRSVPAVSLAYMLTGGLGIAGLLQHHLGVRKDRFQHHAMEQPWMRAEQRMLRDFTVALKGLAGAHAARLVLEAAADALRAAGSEVRIEGETVHAEADTQAWDAALQTALRHAQHLLGPMAARRFEAVREAYA